MYFCFCLLNIIISFLQYLYFSSTTMHFINNAYYNSFRPLSTVCIYLLVSVFSEVDVFCMVRGDVHFLSNKKKFFSISSMHWEDCLSFHVHFCKLSSCLYSIWFVCTYFEACLLLTTELNCGAEDQLGHSSSKYIDKLVACAAVQIKMQVSRRQQRQTILD